MKLIKQSTNATLLKLADGTEILFSYETPVAGWHIDHGRFKSENSYSSTTRKHIGQYFGVGCAKDVGAIPQETINNLLNSGSKK